MNRITNEMLRGVAATYLEMAVRVGLLDQAQASQYRVRIEPYVAIELDRPDPERVGMDLGDAPGFEGWSGRWSSKREAYYAMATGIKVLAAVERQARGY